MLLSSRSNLFSFEFASNFVPQEIEDKYGPYLNRMPGNLLSKCVDVLNYSIQTITLPNLTWDFTEQIGLYGKSRKYRGVTNPNDLDSKDLTITFQMLDGFINYWMMADILRYYYAYENPDKYLPEGHTVRIFDAEGIVMVSINFERVLYREISSIDLSFSTNAVEFQTFEGNFTYNNLNIITEIGGEN